MSLPGGRAPERKSNFKKTIDSDESRRRRSETTVQIRKNIKEDRMNQRRKMGGMMGQDMISGSTTELSMQELQERLAELPEMIVGIQSPDTSIQLDALIRFRKLLSLEKFPPIREVIETGLMPVFVKFLQSDSPSLQFEAAWVLTNIASGTSEDTQVVINHGAVPIFCQLLLSPHDDVREQAVWALGNIAGDSIGCRDMVLRCGALRPILQQLTDNAKSSMLRNATWTLSNFCRGKPQPQFDLVKPALPTLGQLIYTTDEEVLTDACWALSYLSDGSNDKIQEVIEAGVCRRIVELMMHPSPAVQTPALRTVGNIVTGDDVQTQVIINLQALPCLRALLGSMKKGIRKEACWTLSNITAGNTEQIQRIIEADIFPTLISLMATAEFDIRKEAAWAVSNATSGGNAQQIMHLVGLGCIKPLVDLLELKDAKIVIVALEALEHILRVGETAKQGPEDFNEIANLIDEADGVSKIQVLQFHAHEDIYVKSQKIVEIYFHGEEDDGELAPDADMTDSQFNFGLESDQPTHFQFGSNQ